MRRVSLVNPFTAGMVTDVPADSIGPQNSRHAEDGFSPNGRFQQRKGWEFDGTTADVADNLVSVFRAQFALSDVVRTLTCDDDGDMFVHNASSAGTSIFAGTVAYLPRAVYHDEVIWCAQNGTSPIIRYSGSVIADETETVTPAWVVDQATITGITFATAPTSGSFLLVTSAWGFQYWFRILEGSTTSVTLEDVLADNSGTISSITATAKAYPWPAVAIYEAGSASMTSSGGVASGFGTKWSTSAAMTIRTSEGSDAFLHIEPSTGTGRISTINSVTSDTALAILGHTATRAKGSYKILRRCPFKDVANHKGSLWGTGVDQYPNRVYVGPPNWNISLPPGVPAPLGPVDEASAITQTNPNDFLLDFVDVPGPTDGDHNVAILESPNPLLVLKRHAVYGIFGSFGGLSRDLIADGIGCIDIRSAHSYDEGQFWAGESGIYWYTNGQVVDLTAGKINREWRALMRDFDYGTSDYCTLGLASGHLIVHVNTGGGGTPRTYICDLRDQSWQSRLMNVTPRYLYTSRISNEKEKLLGVQDANQGRVINFAPMLDGSGTAKDDSGSYPRLQAYSSTALGRADGIEGITRVVDVDVHANIYDVGAAGSTELAVQLWSGGGIGDPATTGVSPAAIDSDTVDRIDRHHFRFAKRGRFHELRCVVPTLGTDNTSTKVEIAQVDLAVKDLRKRSR